MNEQAYYGQEANSDTKTLRERLRDYYEASEFVKVVNIDSEPLKYQFMRPEDQIVNQPDAVTRNITNIAPPRVVILQPGESKLCPAYEADLMIETLVKKITSNKVADKVRQGIMKDGQSADWTDPTTQKALIDQILLGKQDLINAYNESQVKPVEEDLDESTERPKVGRPRTAQ